MHIDEVRNNLFYQFPQWLLKEPYNNLSNRAMLMYMLLWDRRGLSEKNGWHDENGKVYVYFTNEQFMEVLKCSKQTVVTTKEELHEIGLLKEVRQGVNKPNRLYINGSLKNRLQEVQNLDHGSLKNRLQEVQNLDGINTNIINTNISKITTTTSEQNPLEKTPTDTNIYDYYQQRIGVLDGFQFQQLTEYVTLDGMDVDVVIRAITEAADNGKRNFKYILAILRNWKQNGIKTIAQVEERERQRIEQKANSYQNGNSQSQRTNVPTWSTEPVKTEQTAEGQAKLAELFAELEAMEDADD